MLMANQNQQFWKNVIKTGEYGLDVITTFSGIGNLAKFRYLARLGEASSIIAKVKLGVGLVEVTSGVTNILLKLTGFEDTELGKSIQEYLFWLELLSLSGEITVAIKNGLKKSAKDALTHSDDLKKQLDEVVIEDGNSTRKITEAEKTKFWDEIKEVAEFDNIARNLDSIRLTKLELDEWIKVIRGLGAEVKYYTSSKKMIKYFKAQKCGACFDPWTIPPTIWIRKDATALEMFHESMHFEDFLRRGKENYIRGEARQLIKVGKQTQIPYRDQLISSYIKEKYVLDKILEEQANWIKKYGKGRFTNQEIEFSKRYFKLDVVDKCIKEGIDISKITIKK